MTRERARFVVPALFVGLLLALLLATAKGSVALPFRGVVGALLAKVGLPGDASSLGATGETIGRDRQQDAASGVQQLITGSGLTPG